MDKRIQNIVRHNLRNVKMKIFLGLRILHFDESSQKTMVYLDNSGNMPLVEIIQYENPDNNLKQALDSFFTQSSSSAIFLTKSYSGLSTENFNPEIWFNFYCDNPRSIKSGMFVEFTQNSIELHRFLNHAGTK